MLRFVESVLTTWLAGKVLGENHSLGEVTRRAVNRKLSSFIPKAIVRRQVRRSIRKLF